MPYPILRVSGAPTRVPVRAQRGPCSPRLLPLGLGLLLDLYRRPASEVSCPRSSKPQGAGDEGSRGRTFSGGAGSGPRCLGGKRAWRRFSPRSGLGRSVLIPMWRTGVGTRTGAVIGRRGGGRGSRPGRGRGRTCGFMPTSWPVLSGPRRRPLLRPGGPRMRRPGTSSSVPMGAGSSVGAHGPGPIGQRSPLPCSRPSCGPVPPWTAVSHDLLHYLHFPSAGSRMNRPDDLESGHDSDTAGPGGGAVSQVWGAGEAAFGGGSASCVVLGPVSSSGRR